MSSRTLIEVFGHILFSFTRGVTEHYNPQEPEYTEESFGYSPLESTGREWYRHGDPDEECIYQEYSDREATTLDFIRSSRIDASLIDASLPEENREETQEDQQSGDRAWKRLRPSALRTVCKSMYIGALISLLTATIIGSIYILISYLYFKTVSNCKFHLKRSIPVKVQWVRSISDAVACVFLYASFFVYILFLFRPYQLMGVKGKLILVACLAYFLDTTYRLVLQALGISHSKLSTLQKIPLNVLFFLGVCWQAYLLTKHFHHQRRTLRRDQMALFLQITVPCVFIIILAIGVKCIIYPLYNKQTTESKLRLVIAIFAPLVGVLFKVISRIFVHRLGTITHPGYACVLLAPLYCFSAIIFRMLQADLDNLRSMAVLGLIHGVTEVIERSTMVLIDHICHLIWKRTSAPWGSFRTPRRERLMADIAIMSMLFESTAIVCVNGVLYVYQYIYLKDDSLLQLLQSFAITTSVQLLIEWFFTSVSLAIETRYQNMTVMAVWQRRWKRHISVALVVTISSAIWVGDSLLDLAHSERSEETSNQPCKMPFASE